MASPGFSGKSVFLGARGFYTDSPDSPYQKRAVISPYLYRQAPVRQLPKNEMQLIFSVGGGTRRICGTESAAFRSIPNLRHASPWCHTAVRWRTGASEAEQQTVSGLGELNASASRLTG
jgi:hypothetical protein